MSFYDIRFPKNISYGSSGGPGYNTSVIEVSSGAEQRNANWDYPRCEYDIAYGVREQDDLEALIEFFHIVKGRAYSFRYWDPIDYKSCRTDQTIAFTNQTIGTGDGTEDEFQIYKTYSKTGLNGSTIYSRVRKITKIVASTLVVGVGGVADTDWTLDDETGIITFNVGSEPANEAIVTAGYEFDVHARFDTDQISASLDNYKLGTIDVPIIEVK